jgi:GNAT superfamily N-acetyltransferase
VLLMQVERAAPMTSGPSNASSSRAGCRSTAHGTHSPTGSWRVKGARSSALPRSSDTSPAGLLRSVVVEPTVRGTGIGATLVDSSEILARDLGINELYLLTETAETWFENRG